MKNTIVRILCFFALLAIPAMSWAQTAEGNDPRFWENAFGDLVLFGGAIVVVGALFSLVRLFTVITKMEELRILEEKGIKQEEVAVVEPKENWWDKFLKSATKAVPVREESEIILSHNYDGIRELDNKLPPWWLWMFYASIIFSVFYWFAFHVTGSAPSIHEAYEIEMEEAREAVATFVARKADNIDENNVKLLSDPNELMLGATIFNTNCATCHGKQGEGLAGPNLTDDYWIHGGSISDIFKTIKYGVPGKAMVPWKDLLRPSDIQRVSSYITTLHGTNPPNQKAPEGDLWKPEEGSGGEGTEQPQEGDQNAEPSEDGGQKLSMQTNAN